MHILFLTNYYPPSNYGWGYMQLCEEVADGLAARGHDIVVLTSTNRDGPEIARSYPVHRLLGIDPDWHGGRSAAWQFFVGRRWREREAVTHLCQLASEFRPDVIFIWHAIGLPRRLLQEAEQIPGTSVVYYLAGYLPELPDEHVAYWQAAPVRPRATLFKRPLAKVALRMLRQEGKPLRLKYENVICVSNYVRHRLVSQGLIPPSAVVIHNGVDLSTFSPVNSAAPKFSAGTPSCLVAGRIAPEKGIHTVIDSFDELRAQLTLSSPAILTILGGGPAAYREQVQAKVQANDLQGMVEFHAPIPREQMPEMLARHQVLILPSEYEEPIARSMQEAMAMGLLVIGTTTGGSGELLVHEKTGLVFEAGDSQSLVRQIRRVLQNPGEAASWARAGQRAVEEHFDIRRTVEQIEQYLLSLVGS